MRCSSPVPVGVLCPVCKTVHPDTSKRKWFIVTGIVAGVLLISGIISGIYWISSNRYNLLYTDEHEPIFDWLPYTPDSDDPMEERRPRNIGSFW